jgi:hypothetical protein
LDSSIQISRKLPDRLNNWYGRHNKPIKVKYFFNGIIPYIFSSYSYTQ